MSNSLIPSEPPPSYDDAHGGRSNSANNRLSTGPPPSPRLQRPFPLELPALVSLRGKRIILASKSPRRRQLLAQLGFNNVEIIPSEYPEDLPKSLSPFEYVLQTAQNKAQEVYRREIDSEKGEPGIIIAADTIVVSHSGQILEKPRSQVDHISMLTTLRDTGIHKVYTAVSVMTPLESAIDPGYAMEAHVEETSVKFDPKVSDELILAYVKTRDGVDKAGGYGIQSTGSILIESIDGTYDNVVGLPLRPLLKLIEKVMDPEYEHAQYDEPEDDEV